MFVGRTHELEALERLYNRSTFQMAVVYGRRRVGKTALLDEFSKDKRTLYFTAQQKSNSINLQSFTQTVLQFYGLPQIEAFSTWEDALRFIALREQAGDPMVFVFDELPYAAQAAPSLPSTLQILIDHEFKQTNICMILCGSNEGFMESNVLGRKSPLYGRRNAQIKLLPFDCFDAALMMPGYTPQQCIELYAMLGGTPYYLEQIDPNASIGENTERLFFDIAGLLYAEPQMLLRQELREPALYTSVLDAIASGATAPKAIANKAGVEETSVGKYLATLIGLDLIEKITPFEAGPRSRRSIYRIKDPFFAFWYRFVSPQIGAIEVGAGHAAAQMATGDAFSTYMGRQFETVCRQWLMRQSAAGSLPFLANYFGTWWGTDPAAKEQVDIDVIAATTLDKIAIVGECKWRESFNETEALDALMHRAALLGDYHIAQSILFTKNQVSKATAGKMRNDNDAIAVSADELFE